MVFYAHVHNFSPNLGRSKMALRTRPSLRLFFTWVQRSRAEVGLGTRLITWYFCGTLTHLRSSQRGDDALAPMYATKFNVCNCVRKNSYTAKPVMSAGQHERHSYHVSQYRYCVLQRRQHVEGDKIMPPQLSSYRMTDPRNSSCTEYTVVNAQLTVN